MRAGIHHSFSVGGCASAGYAEDGGATGSARGAPLKGKRICHPHYFLFRQRESYNLTDSLSICFSTIGAGRSSNIECIYIAIAINSSRVATAAAAKVILDHFVYLA